MRGPTPGPARRSPLVAGLALVSALVASSSPTPAGGQATGATLADAREHARAGLWSEALAAYAGLWSPADLGRDPGAVRAAKEHAAVLLTLARYDDALELVSDGERARAPGLENARGEALAGLGRLDEAEAAFRAAEEAGGPQRLVARKNRGVLLWLRGERDEALRLFDGFIDVYNRGGAGSARELAAVGTAVKHLAVENPALFQDALMAFDEAAAADPSDFLPELLVGELFLEKYVAPEAHASFDAVLDENPRHPRALLGKARVLDFDGEGAGAMTAARAALEPNPENPDVRAFLGRLHLATGDDRLARREAERALRTNPVHPDALSVLAAVHYFADDRSAYRAVRDRALTAYPGYAGFFVTLAELAERRRRYHDAVELASEAVARHGRSARALGVLGMNELRVGRIEEGRDHVDRAFELDPYNPWYKNTLDLLDTFESYRTVRTEHFELFLHGREAELLGPYAASLAEEAWDALAARYGELPPTPVRVEIFPSHADFSVRTLGLVGLGALGVSFGSTLVMDSPSAREPGDFNWASTFWHELAHAFHLGMTGHRVPRWFSEGLSVREQRLARGRWGLGPTPSWLRAYAADRMPPVSSLDEAFVRPSYPEQIVHGYYQASLVFEMIEGRWGFDAVLEMLRGYGDGASTAEVVESALGVGPDELDDAFDAWVRERYGDEMAAVESLADSPHAGAQEPGATELETLRTIARRRPGSFPARLALGRALFEEGLLDQAEGELRAALRLFPEYGAPEGPLRWLARIHRARGETAQAAGALHALGRLGESLWRVHVGEAELRLETGDTAAAAAALERAVEVVPFEVELHERLAEAYGALGDAEGEVRERAAVLALDPADRAEALYRLADAHRRAGDRGAARSRVLQALEIAPSYDAALELLLELRGGGR